MKTISFIIILFDVLLKFPFTTNEMMANDCLPTWYIRVASRVAEQLMILGFFGNIRKVS